MNDWRTFLNSARSHLLKNACPVRGKETWCAWTTFERLGSDAGYWTAPLPAECELLEESTTDGGNWGQPFFYRQIAHLIIPRQFGWERFADGIYTSGMHQQDIDGLSEILRMQGIAHHLGKIALDIKLY